MLDGVTVAEERLRRVKGVNFMIQAGIVLRLPHTTIWVAGVFFHRFFMRESMVEKPEGGVHHYVRPTPGTFPARRND